MSQLISIVQNALGEDGVQAIALQLGESPEKTSSAIDQALPMMLASLSNQKNAGSGWSLLTAFLDKNQDGSILDDLLGMAFGRGTTGPVGAENDAALKRILGGSQSAVEARVEGQSGLNSGNGARLMAMLAPIVIGALAKMQQSGNLDQRGLEAALEKEQHSLKTSNPQASGFIGGLLDSNKDGNIADDLARASAGFFEKFLN